MGGIWGVFVVGCLLSTLMFAGILMNKASCGPAVSAWWHFRTLGSADSRTRGSSSQVEVGYVYLILTRPFTFKWMTQWKEHSCED